MQNLETNEEEIIVMQEQGIDRRERAVAVKGLRYAIREFWDPKILQGILWWKLSTVPAHFRVEPFVLLIGKHQQIQDSLDEELIDVKKQYYKEI